MLVRKALRRANIARPICSLLLGHHHKASHRMIVGVMVMVVGVLIAKLGGHVQQEVVAFLSDGIGYALHGMGLVPFIEHLAEELA